MGRAAAVAVVALILSAGVVSTGEATTKDPKRVITVGGYAEGYYGWNLGQPGNGITNFRAFDTRHNSFTLLNAVLSADWTARGGYGRVALQVGTSADTYYGAEVSDAGASGAGPHNHEVFKHVQEAYAGAAFADDLVRVEAGLMLSPIGPESMAIKDHWTLSRSNLYYAFPFYHLGARAHVAVSDATQITLGVYNGWDGLLDKNHQKTVSLAVHHKLSDDVEFDVQYFTGVERPANAPEGTPIRHLVDAWVKARLSKSFAIIFDVDVGMEDGDLGRSGWASAGLWTRLQVAETTYVSTQSDFMREWRGAKDGKRASAIFWPVEWVTSHALCVEQHVGSFAAMKLEYRFDKAGGNMYFAGAVEKDSISHNWIENADSQQTITLALTSWF